MEMDKMDDMVCFNQKPATGDHTDAEHAKNVEAEAAAHGDTPTPVGGHGQGGQGH